MRAIPGVILIALFGNGFFPPDVPPFVRTLLPAIGAMLLIGAALAVATGVGLLMKQPWARMLGIISAGIGLIDIPFGTALGIYTLWVL